jgi:cytochrome c
MQDNNNTIAGWVLFAGIVALGGTLAPASSSMASGRRRWVIPIEGVVEEGAGGAEAEQPIEFYLASADVAKGADVFKKCQACHTIDQGGANGLGPNLWATCGKPHGHVAGFRLFGRAEGRSGQLGLEGHERLARQSQEVCAGHQDDLCRPQQPEDRANVIAYLNPRAMRPCRCRPRRLPRPRARRRQGGVEADDAGARRPRTSRC